MLDEGVSMDSDLDNDAGRRSNRVDNAGRLRFEDLATDALRYWEPRRWIYNAVLLAVVVIHFVVDWQTARVLIAPESLLQLFVFAVLANIAYCAAYAIDVFVQFSELRSRWARWRWLVLVLGIAFGSVIAHFIMTGMIQGATR
jgi:hypothetical protein